MSATGLPPSWLDPLRKVTVPVGVPLPRPAVTVAVRVTGVVDPGVTWVGTTVIVMLLQLLPAAHWQIRFVASTEPKPVTWS